MEKSITKIIEDVREKMCDGFCKWPEAPIPEGKDDNWLFEDGSPCENCPLNRL